MKAFKPSLCFLMIVLLLGAACARDEIFDDRDLMHVTRDNKPIQPPSKFPQKNLSDKDKLRDNKNEAMSQIDLCRKIVERLSIPLHEFKGKLASNVPIDPNVLALTQLVPQDCLKKDSQAKNFYVISQFLKSNPGKVGVVVPLSSNKKVVGEALLRGLKIAFAASGDSRRFDSVFLVRDSMGDDSKAINQVAELVLQHNITFLITAASSAGGMKELGNLVHRLILPTFMVYKDSQLISRSPFIFHVFPRDEDSVQGLATAMKARGFTTLSILKPTSGKADRLCDHLTEELSLVGITVPQTIPYVSGNYRSMSEAAMQLAGTDPQLRAEEYKQLLAEGELKAKSEGQVFNPRFVVLKPRLQSGAVFIPDNYRIVRHFINLFKYQGIKGLILVGNNEWRARAIAEPWEPFMNGAMFADYVGRYDMLPKGVTYTLDGSNFYVPLAQIVDVDLQLIGYRVGNLTLALSAEQGIKRYQWQKKITAYGKEGYFGNKISFGEDQVLNWPTYVFTFRGAELEVTSVD